MFVSELTRFGPFADTELAFEKEPNALQLIFGPNEAGKSSALRGIAALFYGIELRTQDAHTYPMPDLRLAGTLRSAAGDELRVVRLKRKKQTLRAPGGAAIPETELARFLGGIGEQAFKTSFGLDHESLRRGAEALHRGEGNAGVALFEAGLGGGAVQRLVESLRTQREELFLPRGRKQILSQQLVSLRKLSDHLKNQITGPKAVVEQEEGLAQSQAELTELEDKRENLALSLEQLKRLKLSLPKLGERRRTRAALNELRGRALFNEEELCGLQQSRERETELLRERAGQLRALERLKGRLAELGEASAIEEVSALQIEELSDGVGSYRQQKRDLPKRQAELAELLAQRQARLKGLGGAVQALPVFEVGCAVQDFAS